MKLKIIISLLILSLLISGCKGVFKRDVEYSPSITSEDIYTGKQGLTMEFLENAPPKEIFDNSVLPIGLRLYNKGAYDIGSSDRYTDTQTGYLSIGLEAEYMELNEGSLKSTTGRVNFQDPQHIEFELVGKDILQPGGGQEAITFSVNTKDLSVTDPQSEYHTSLIAITSCYKYQTKAVETVCIDTDVYDLRKREKPCEVRTRTLNSQGAPIGVTKIESEMLPDKDNIRKIKPRFAITVKNLGNGQVIRGNDQTVRGACGSESLGYKDWNNVIAKVYISTIEDKNQLDCAVGEGKEGARDEGIINLKGKEDTIRCTFEDGFEETRGAFSSPLYIILDYGYTDTISREVKIKRI